MTSSAVRRPRPRERTSRDFVAAGYRAEKAGRLDEAEKLYRRAIADGDAFGFNNLAQLLVADGRLSEAEATYASGVAAGDALAAKNFALFLLEEGREREAAEAIRVADELGRAPSAEELREARAWRNR